MYLRRLWSIVLVLVLALGNYWAPAWGSEIRQGSPEFWRPSFSEARFATNEEVVGFLRSYVERRTPVPKEERIEGMNYSAYPSRRELDRYTAYLFEGGRQRAKAVTPLMRHIAEERDFLKEANEKEVGVFRGEPFVREALEAVLRRLEAAVPDVPEADSRIHIRLDLVETDEVNAVSRSYGTIQVYSGFVEKLGVGDESAAVLAHELAHVVLNHEMLVAEAKNLVTQNRVDLGFLPLGQGKRFDLARRLAVAKLSRLVEKEADLFGLATYLRAGFPACSFVEGFDSFLSDEGYSPVNWSTHPGRRTRLEYLEAAVNQQQGVSCSR